MKKEKKLKLGLIAMTMMFLILGTTCKKSDESANDIDTIISFATQSISDLNKFSSAANIGNQKQLHVENQAAAACQPISAGKALNQAITGVVNPSPGHGWMTGQMTVSVYADCSVIIAISASIDCSQGATMANGDTLGGVLSVHGTINTTAGSVNMVMIEESSNFIVNGRSHDVFLNIRAQGTLAGGTVTITGQIDGDYSIDYTESY
jgi:hypothetical protein